MTQEQILTLREAAEYLRLSQRTLLRLLREGRIPGRKIGGQWRLTERRLTEYVEARVPKYIETRAPGA